MRMATLLLWLCASPALSLPGHNTPGTLSESQELFAQRRYESVVEKLSPQQIQKLRSNERMQAYDLLARSHHNQGRIDKAIGVYQLAIQLFPKDINLLNHLAELLHGTNLDDRARPLYARVLAIHPNNAVANLGMAEIERSTGFLEKAANHYAKCLEEWSDNPSLWRAYAEVLAERRDYGKAAEAIKKSLSLDSDNASSLQALSKLQRQQGLTAQAYKTLNQADAAAAADPAFLPLLPHLTLLRGLWLLEDNRLDDSKRQAEKILAASPKDPLALWLRASIHLRLGRTREAGADLSLAAAQSRQAPFVASVAAAMLKEIQTPP